MAEESTCDKILVSARKIFVEQGFAGASMANIAKLAEVTHSLIFHHFGNKENLWRAVKQNIAQDSEQQSKTLPSTNLPFAAFLRELIINSISFYRNNPDIMRMINWQRLEYNTDQNIGITLSAESQAWIAAFKHYQQKGDINSKLKIEFIVTLLLSIVSSAALDQNIFISNEKSQQAYIDFCVAHLQKAFA